MLGEEAWVPGRDWGRRRYGYTAGLQQKPWRLEAQNLPVSGERARTDRGWNRVWGARDRCWSFDSGPWPVGPRERVVEEVGGAFQKGDAERCLVDLLRDNLVDLQGGSSFSNRILLGRLESGNVVEGKIRRWVEVVRGRSSGICVFKIHADLVCLVFPTISLADSMDKVKYFRCYGKLLILDRASLDAVFAPTWIQVAFGDRVAVGAKQSDPNSSPLDPGRVRSQTFSLSLNSKTRVEQFGCTSLATLGERVGPPSAFSASSSSRPGLSPESAERRVDRNVSEPPTDGSDAPVGCAVTGVAEHLTVGESAGGGLASESGVVSRNSSTFARGDSQAG